MGKDGLGATWAFFLNPIFTYVLTPAAIGINVKPMQTVQEMPNRAIRSESRQFADRQIRDAVGLWQVASSEDAYRAWALRRGRKESSAEALVFREEYEKALRSAGAS